MISKHLKTAACLLLIILPIFISGLIFHQKKNFVMSRGNYFFDKTRNRADIKEITLDFGASQRISIVLRDGLWRIKEADDYYAATQKINTLVKLIRQTIVYRADPLLPDDIQKHLHDSFKIESKNKFGDIVDSAVVAPKKDINKFQYAMLNNQPYLYQLKGDLALSPVLMDWVHAPLLQIDTSEIMRFKCGNFAAYRGFSEDSLKNTDTNTPADFLYSLLHHFHYLTADEIRHASNFRTDGLKHLRDYDITLLNGIIYHIQIFSKNNEYWMTVRLNKEKLTANNAANFIKNNKLFYEGWYFKLERAVGENLAYFIF